MSVFAEMAEILNDWLTTNNNRLDLRKQEMRKHHFWFGVGWMLIGIIATSFNLIELDSVALAMPGLLATVLGFAFAIMSGVMWVEQYSVNEDFLLKHAR